MADGRTATPNFSINISGRPVPLEEIDADHRRHQRRYLSAAGRGDASQYFVHGNRISGSLGWTLRATTFRWMSIFRAAKLKICCALQMGTDPPVMMGKVHLQTKLDIPPGQGDIADRLYLKGKFQVSGAHFSNEHIQSKVDALSERSQGKPKAGDR